MSFYIASETCRDCVGEHCPVCSVIRQYESALRGLGGVMFARVSGAVQILFVLFAAAMIAAVLQQGTPVSRKVRLNLLPPPDDVLLLQRMRGIFPRRAAEPRGECRMSKGFAAGIVIGAFCTCMAYAHRRVIKAWWNGEPMPKAPEWHVWVEPEKRRG